MIAIPNMEKPKSCEDCQFLSLDGVVTDDNEWVSYEICEVTEQLIKEDITCPLIEIVTCGECIHFHYDKPYIIQGIPVLGHEVCDFWGDGCKTNPNGFCSYGERRSE